jgi:GT2 family glycosyltransferase
MRPTLALGIPTINRKDLLDEALSVYRKTWKNRHIYIVDNGNQGVQQELPYLRVYRRIENMGVAASWNKMANHLKLLGYSHIMILNDDVIVEKDPYEIEDWLEANPADFYTGGGYYSFILPIDTFHKVGEFDSNFYPAYYEDNDYTYRLQLMGLKKLDSDFLKPEVLRLSKSGEKNPSLYDKVHACRRYYIMKWGGAPNEEVFTKPFERMVPNL